MEFFRPDVIVLELGMDALAGDPLTHLRLTNNAVVEVIERLLRFNHPMLVAGGGGYHVENTVRGWALAWRTCCGENEECDFGLGMGGVMLASTEWAGGLRDRDPGRHAWSNAGPLNRSCRPPSKPSPTMFFRLHGIQARSDQGVTTPGRFG